MMSLNVSKLEHIFYDDVFVIFQNDKVPSCSRKFNKIKTLEKFASFVKM